MHKQDRFDRIVRLVDESGFLTVTELGKLLDVSEMTVRRDLEQLAAQSRLQRTYGGAASMQARKPRDNGDTHAADEPHQVLLSERVDALITTALNPHYDGQLLDSIGTKNVIPIVAESLPTQRGEPVVWVDNFQAGRELGRWAGEYTLEHWGGQAHILDLTYYLANTQTRSRGFIIGIREILPAADVQLSLDAQSRYKTAYQLTRDALAVHPQINIIFGINDIIAWGAINACRDLGIDPQRMMVLPFGLEGDTLKNALMENTYCKAGLAMFPEIVGRVCIEAAIAAYRHEPLPQELVTPHVVLTPQTLPDFYQRQQDHWEIRWEKVFQDLTYPSLLRQEHTTLEADLPRRIGFIVPFIEHEWYQSLVKTMRSHAAEINVEFEIVDVHQSLKDEVELCRREIAAAAADMVREGEVILIDGGPLTAYLAEALVGKKDITVITNSMQVYEILRASPDIIMILTGGAYRHSSQVLVGPTAESALSELRADRLFLSVAGISLDFGLSHTNISEVTIKQAMIHSAREVVLLADHTCFEQESTIQVAGLNVVHKLVTDDALPASIRLELTKRGIQILLANV
jgi:DeoR/GlpR family transcriptional regulator of sugar metabolism